MFACLVVLLVALCLPASSVAAAAERDITNEQYLSHEYYKITTGDSAWVEIGVTGKKSSCSNLDDSPLQGIQLNFTFPFFGHKHNKVLISPNGMLLLDLQTTCEDFGYCGWSTAGILRYIAPYSSDFDGSLNPNSAIYYQTDFVNGKTRFITQWENMYLWNSTFDTSKNPGYSFQVIIWSNGDIKFNYKLLSTPPNTIRNAARSRLYPLIVGVENSVVLQQDGFNFVSPYKAISLNATAKTSTSITLTATPTCLDYPDCFSCADKSLAETNLKCGWCPISKSCTDGFAHEVSSQAACATQASLIFTGQCPNPGPIIAGAVIGGVIALLIIALIIFIIYRRVRKYILELEGRLGGKTGDELPQLPSDKPETSN